MQNHKNESSYPLVDINGSPKQMGRVHGSKLRRKVHATVRAMKRHVGIEPYEACWADFRDTAAYCRENAPELVEEMEGIAEGAEIDFRDVFKINAHLDLITWKRHMWTRPKDLKPECSSHAVVTDQDVLVGWNGDDWRGWMDCGAVVRGIPESGEPFIYWSLAGSVGRPGMNRFLALGANSLPSKRWRPDGLLYPMICRKILACRTTDEAIDVFSRYNRCSATNYLVADGAGGLASVEANADQYAVLRPVEQNGRNYLLHTNHYLAPELQNYNPAQAEKCTRLSAALRLYHKSVPGDAGELCTVLSDHTGGICVHHDDVCTIVSFTAEIHTRRFRITRGNPCAASGVTYRLVDRNGVRDPGLGIRDHRY